MRYYNVFHIRQCENIQPRRAMLPKEHAAALVNASGLGTASSFKNSTAYIQNWLSVLKNDKHFIVSAAGKAEKAVKLILGA